MKNLFAKQSCAKKKLCLMTAVAKSTWKFLNHGLWLPSFAMQNATVESLID